MRGQVLLALGATIAVLGLAQPAAAQDRYEPGYAHEDARRCEQAKNSRTAGGAILGAIIGAVIGNNVAGDQSDGSVGGAIVGGVAGGAIGRNSVRCDAQGDAYYGEPGYADRGGDPSYDRRDPNYRGDNSGLYGGPGYERDRYASRTCEWRPQRWRDEYGRTHRERVYMCQDRRGNWRPARG